MKSPTNKPSKAKANNPEYSPFDSAGNKYGYVIPPEPQTVDISLEKLKAMPSASSSNPTEAKADKELKKKMHEMLEVQGTNGTWIYDLYMYGMYNGMEFMLSMAEDREPVYKEAPTTWLADIKLPPNIPSQDLAEDALLDNTLDNKKEPKE